MIAVVFEVTLKDANDPRYFELAAGLREELARIDGFISVERFKSLTVDAKFLSLSFWRDEESVARWRAHLGHQAAQDAGRAALFRDYRIRVAHVLRDYGLDDRAAAPVRAGSSR